MLDANCPNCGAPIRFRSSDLPVKVCDYCRSTIRRNGEDLEKIGTVAEVPEDVSPLQIGVRGRDGDLGFELLGRVRWRYEDGAWNEWLAMFSDGSTGWLGESMGRYMLLREVQTGRANSTALRLLADGRAVPVGTEATIDKVEYRVSDVKTVRVVASEGELPFPAPVGLSAISLDLMTADTRCASIQKQAGEDVEVYVGRYVTLAEIAATGLRSFEDWPMPAYTA